MTILHKKKSNTIIFISHTYNAIFCSCRFKKRRHDNINCRPNEITVPLSSSLFTHIYNLCTNQVNITRLFIKLFTLCPYTINKVNLNILLINLYGRRKINQHCVFLPVH
ncbi:Valine--tRNA ligase [Trichinella spiralis]|uniref:Valine--tRNA ligase n=1 Tax=Trichinella spiralis TaxID=6334 RepID=A0ABR3KAE0_TRISP